MVAQAQDLEGNLQEMIKKRKDVRMMEIIAIKYLTFYFICQGLLIVGVMGGSSDNSFKCHQSWLLFGMSFIMTTAYFIKLLQILILRQQMFSHTIELMSHKMIKERGIVFMLSSIIVFIIITVVAIVAIWMILCGK